MIRAGISGNKGLRYGIDCRGTDIGIWKGILEFY